MFKTITGFSNYEINEDGVIINKKTNIKPNIRFNRQKYKVVSLKDDFGIFRTQLVHRLLMITFKPIENYENYSVDHIDCDKTNNNLDNLEWVTSKENTHRAIKNGLYSNKRKSVSDETVIKIRQEYIPGPKGNYKQLMEKYNINKSMFYYIVKDQYRTDLPLTKELNSYFKEKDSRCSGECNGRSILTKEDVLFIRSEEGQKYTTKELAQKYGVSYNAIRDVILKKKWINI